MTSAPQTTPGLRKINEAVVASDDGWSIRLAYSHLTYFEGKAALWMEVEHETEPYKLVVFMGTARRWHPPFEETIVTPEDKERIGTRLRAALSLLGGAFELTE